MKIKRKEIDGQVWFVDENNNQASVEYFSSEEAAKKSLESLVNCFNCINCRYCDSCSSCRSCSSCSYCSSCRSCSSCSDVSFKNRREQNFNVPKIENIHQKLAEAVKLESALDMSDWHAPCGTSHCRAGWIVHLAGKEGYELEKETSTLFAAQQIYKASGYRISPNRFFDSKEKALEDINRLAK